MRSAAGGRLRLFCVGVVFAVGALSAMCGTACAAPQVHPSLGSFGSFSNVQPVAVDPATGDVYVIDDGTATVQRFTATGVPDDFAASQSYVSGDTLTGTPGGGFQFDTGGSATEIAVAPPGAAGGTAGDIYVTESAANGFQGEIDIFDSSGNFLGQLTQANGNPFGESCGVAVDPSGNVYVGEFGGNVDRYVPTTNPPTDADYDAQIASGLSVCNVAADSTGAVYASTWPFGPLTKFDASQFGAGSPSGTQIDASSTAVATDATNDDVYVDHGDQIAQYDSSGTQIGQSGVGQLSGSSEGVAIRGSSGDLYASDVNHVMHFGPVPPPAPPVVTTDVAQDITPATAALTGRVNPNNLATTYYFEYGTTTAYGTSVPATHDADAGSGGIVVAAVQRISGLQANTTYHFRLVATNSVGTTPGQDQTFTTTTAPPASSLRARIPGTGFLPDNRGWEKVSPTDKNGGDIIADSQLTRAASDGSAVGFASLAAFGDAVGSGIATDYMSTRGSTGWETHAITPPQEPLTIRPIAAVLLPQYVGSFSSDLSKGVFLGWSPVTPDPEVANVSNLYLRTDLRTRGAGSYQLLTGCPLCQSTSTPLPGPLGNSQGAGEPTIAGASTDFGHALFESQQPLTADAAGCNNHLDDPNECPPYLYEWDHGTVRLAGILPDESPAHGSMAGNGAGRGNIVGYTPHTMSSDGSRIIFTVPGDPNIYMRIDHLTTVQLNASERSVADPNPGQAAKYWDASVDGSRVFFTTTEALTDDASLGGTTKLYMYDASKPASDAHNLTYLSPDNEPADSSNGSVQSVAAVSDDGHYVYFTAANQLVAGQPGIDRGMYVWHDGSVRFIAPIDAADPPENSTSESWFDLTRVSQATPDGTHLLFSSTAPLGPTGFDQTCSSQGTCRQLYIYSYATQRLACVSCNQDATRASTLAFSNGEANNGTALTTSALNHPMSDNGRRVFFSTAEALVPEDVNGKIDAYEYDVPSGTLHLLSSGRDTSNSYFLNASASGDDAFFATRAQLTSVDADDSYDLYDARVGGGFPEPPPPAPTCIGESCRAPQTASPRAGAVGSGDVTSNGNVPSARKAKPKSKPVRCRHGYLRKKVHGKVRCVKKHKLHRAKKASEGKGPRRIVRTHRRSK